MMYSRPKGVLLAHVLLLMGLAPVPGLATIEWTFSPSCSSPPCATDSGGFQTFLGSDALGSGTGPIVAASGLGSAAAGAGGPIATNAASSTRLPGTDTTLAMGKIARGGAGLGVGKSGAPSSGNGGIGTGASGAISGPVSDNGPAPDLQILPPCPTSYVTAPDGATCIQEAITLSEASLWQSSTSAPWQTGYAPASAAGQPATTKTPTSIGWELIASSILGPGRQPAGGKVVSSSDWIVTPFNPALCKNGNCVPDSLISQQATGLRDVVAASSQLATAVPAPGTLLLLFAGGLPLIRRMSSSRAKRVHH